MEFFKNSVPKLQAALDEEDRLVEARLQKWDRRMLELAKHVGAWSKDPSTKVGAVIVRPDWTIASLGYNGFARGLDDSPELYADRPTKLSRTVHAEMNAILSAREPIKGYQLFCEIWPCDRCAVHIIQAGIKRVVVGEPIDPELGERWKAAFEATRALFKEGGVDARLYPNG